MMHFASDNTGPVHPAIMAALADANTGWALPYGNDAVTERAVSLVREVFEAPEASVHFVATGTAANALILATMAEPWQTIYCAPRAHVAEDECGAPEFFSGGAKLTLVGTTEDRMSADDLTVAMAGTAEGDVHGVQRGPVSITSVTERGTLYRADDIAAIAKVAHAHGQRLHLDGARFANACAALDCTAAEMSWRAGVDAVSFGGTKNGCLGVEAVVFFDPALAWQFELRRKRAGHLLSKTRYLSAQMVGYLEDDLWLTMARSANATAARFAERLEAHPDATLRFPVEANMIFLTLPRAHHQRLHAAGARYSVSGDLGSGDPDEPLGARLVCDWSLPWDACERFLDLLS